MSDLGAALTRSVLTLQDRVDALEARVSEMEAKLRDAEQAKAAKFTPTEEDS